MRQSIPRSATRNAIILWFLALSACGEDGTGVEPPPDATGAIATLQIDPGLAAIDIGGSVNLTARARNSAGVLLSGRAITWSVANLNIATVSNSGLVTGVAVGSTLVMAVAEGVSGTAIVNVNPRPISQDWGISTPTLVQGSDFATVAAGYEQTCSLDADGHAWCWGGGPSGSRTPTRVPGDLRFTSITTGDGWTGGHSCAVDQQGKAYCWGVNNFGQLGNGSTTSSVVPTPVSGAITFTALAAGQTRVCALASDGAAYCWGENFVGSLGDGSQERRTVPTRVAGGLTFVAITAGANHTCALTASGDAWCWGGNDNGELGIGSISSQFTATATPTRVVTTVRFKAISAGAEHTCALNDAGLAYCWGWNQWGQLGRSGRTDLPELVDETIAFASISGGLAHTCALDPGGKAFCWGVSAFGELGDGQPIRPTAPTVVRQPLPVVGGLVFESISVGAMHACALTTTHAVYCWGHKENGALGTP